MSNEDVEVVILDDGPWEAYLDGITEDSLLKCYKENPEKYADQVKEFEEKMGRKIGTASPDEIAYREKAWEAP